jgi:hypothetical protein
MNHFLFRFSVLALVVTGISTSAIESTAGTATKRPQGNTTPTSGSGKWQLYSPRDKKFVVMAPGKPERKQEGNDSGYITYFYKWKQGSNGYQITHIDGPDAASAANALETLSQSISQKIRDGDSRNGKFSDLRTISLQGYPGRSFYFTSGLEEYLPQGNSAQDAATRAALGVGEVVQYRYYAVGKRLYMLASGCKGQDCSNFFNSFKVQ